MNAFTSVDKDTFYGFVASRRGERYEYVRGRIVQQMTGGTRYHGLVARRITRLIEDQVDPEQWAVLPERGVETAVTIRYPEIVLEPAGEPPKSLSTLQPALIVEVLSPSSVYDDLDVKPGEYMSLASLDAYIVASQDEPALLVWARGTDGSFPSQPREVRGHEQVVSISGRGFAVSLPLATIYRDIA